MWRSCCRAANVWTWRWCAKRSGTPTRTSRQDELTRDFGGFELGSLPPIGSLLAVPVIIDPEVREHGPVVFAAGSQTESVKVDAAALFAAVPARVAPLTEAWALGRS